MSRRFFFALIVYSSIPLAAIASGISYNVDFEGLDDAKTLKSIKLASHLTSLKKRPPASIKALRYRADLQVRLTDFPDRPYELVATRAPPPERGREAALPAPRVP